MLYQIASFLLDVVGGLLTGACLLRLYMQWQRVPFSNPVGGLVFALTDWLIMPLRRVIPPVGRWDVSSLVAAMLMQLVQYALLTLLLGAGSAWAWLPWLALFGLLRVAVSGLIGLLICSMGFLGGLVMSAIKRDRGVKDWGNLIQGHGGMLDRVDSICFAAPVFFHVVRYFWEP